MRPSTRAAHARRIMWSAVLTAAFALLVAACTTPPGQEVPQELSDAIETALPDLERFELVRIDDDPIIEALEAAATDGSNEPIVAALPILRADGSVATVDWIAYHVDVRDLLPAIQLPDSDVVAGIEQLPQGPSLTFRGIPDWDDNTLFARLEELESVRDIGDALLQPSVLNLIGGRLEGALLGTDDDTNASVLEHLETMLELHVGADEAARLAALTESNYLVYRQQEFQPPVLHGEQEPPGVGANGAHAEHDGENPLLAYAQEPSADGAERSLHVNGRTLRPVMIADDTIYDPDTGTWLINNWFARVDAAANRQNAYFLLANIAPDVSTGSTLTSDNNRIIVRTKISGYLVLTPLGKSRINPKPSDTCGGEGTFIDVVRTLSNTYTTVANEYWMWWTRHYGGGCAYIRTLGRTPQAGAVGWSGFGDATVDWTSFVFMHESGHIIGGTHVDDNATSPDTVSSHRCNLFGFWPVGPTGPSLMSYASGTRTYCFAATPATGSPKRNLTNAAEYLHSFMQ